MLAGAILLTGLALTALALAVVAADARAKARADRKAAELVQRATAEHVRNTVLRKPFSVTERPPGCDSPLAMLINENGRIVPLPIPQGSHPVFGRVPRGVS